MKSNLRIAFIQMDILWEDPTGNLSELDSILKDRIGQIDLVILPEMFTTGFTMNALSMAETMEGRSIQWMAKKAMELQSHLIGSLIIAEGGTYYNRLIWMGPGGSLCGHYDKKHLFGMAGESRVFTPGSTKLQMQIHNWHITPFICYDLRFPVWNRCVAGEEVLVFIANFPNTRIEAWDTLLRARAIENQCFVIGVNRVGRDGSDLYYSGHSCVIDPNGKVLAALEGKPDIILYDLDYFIIEKTRQQLPFLRDQDEFKIL